MVDSFSEVAVQASEKVKATGENPKDAVGKLLKSSGSAKINLDPQNQNSEDENDWQTIPILRQHQNRYKRKRLSTPSPEKQDLRSYNRYSALNVDDAPQVEVTSKTLKPPPIMLYGIKNVTKLKETIEVVLDKTQYSFKIVTKNQMRVSTENMEAYKKIMAVVREKQLIGHTFVPKSERPCRIVIKNLHHSTPIQAIKDVIEETGNTVKGEIINARHGSTKTPLSTWFVNLEPGPNNSEVKNIKYIYHTSVKIEDPIRKNTIPQCKRCQQYGHTKNYCMRPYRCVKCAESHNTADCPKKDRQEPAKCALCLEDHAANYRGCRVFKEIEKRKFGSRPNNKSAKPNQQESKNPKKPKSGTDEYTPNLGNKTYAQATAGVTGSLEAILSEQTKKLDRLIDHMSTLMGLLTTIVNKLVK